MVQANKRATPQDKRRRRRRALGPIIAYVVVVFALAWFFESQATTTIIFVRHADTDVAMSGSDVELNSTGRARAEALADFVRDIDVVASVDAIYASEFRRTQQTAMPLASQLGIEIEIADHHDYERFMADVLKKHKGEIILIVSHSDTIAPLIDELHGSKNLAPIESDDYDNFYIVTIPNFGKVKTLQLHYPGPDVGSQPGYGKSSVTFN